MRALTYEKAHDIENFSIGLNETSEPILREFDVLVSVQAIGINPGETWIRKTRSAEPGSRVLLGWEFAGIVVAKAANVQGFSIGDRVFGSGDMTRDGAWAERLAVDHRILSKIPAEVSFIDAASLPIGALTAWEAMFRDGDTLPNGVKTVLIVGGAGGVGSVATQLLKATTETFVIATASRPASQTWCRNMGADVVLDHTKDIESQLASAKIAKVDFVLSTAKTSDHLAWIAKVLRPFGHFAFVDGLPTLDLGALMMKSISVYTEMVFSRTLNNFDVHRQGAVLKEVSGLLEDGRLKPITTQVLDGLSVETMKTAHQILESSHTIGKVVISLDTHV
jgi:NADPH:quinone reductase